MEMVLYKTDDSENVINKTLTEIDRFNIELKKSVSVSSPTIVLNNRKEIDLLSVNYCYLSKFNRFYFIRDIEADRTLLYFDLECDVLESFKSDILNSECEYTRTMKTGEFMKLNTNEDMRKSIDIYSNEIEINPTKNIVLSTIGGV